jgi:mono/diheme cytochrome c family protein
MAPGLGAQGPSPEQGKPLYERYCLACHGETGRGDGPAAVYLYPQPRDFTRGLFKVRTTPSGSLPTDRDLMDTIARGMPGSAMPGFAQIPMHDRHALVNYLKTFVEAYQYRKPELPVRVGVPAPKTAASLKLGQEMYRKMECFKCHGETGMGDGPSAAELKDDWDIPIQVRDFTDGTYKGGPADGDLYLRFTTGMTGTPMPAYSDDKMSAAERWALVHYVQSLRRPDRPVITPPVGGSVRVARVNTPMPLDPLAVEWKQAAAVDLPMNPLWQRPATVSHIVLRALYNDKEIAFLLEWKDPLLDSGAVRTEEFRDAVALQFALPSDQPLTFIGMGHQQGAANLWQWKSDWQAQLAAAPAYPNAHNDFYPFGTGFLAGRDAGNSLSAEKRSTPVENLAAIGFGTLATQPAQTVEGRGVWNDGRWRVVFKRPLQGAGQNDVSFAPGATIPFAVACWDGAQGDRDGQKMISTWYQLRLAPAAATRKTASASASRRTP